MFMQVYKNSTLNFCQTSLAMAACFPMQSVLNGT